MNSDMQAYQRAVAIGLEQKQKIAALEKQLAVQGQCCTELEQNLLKVAQERDQWMECAKVLAKAHEDCCCICEEKDCVQYKALNHFNQLKEREKK